MERDEVEIGWRKKVWKKEKATKRKRAVYTYRKFEIFKYRKQTERSNSENNNKLTFFAAFTSKRWKKRKTFKH